MTLSITTAFTDIPNANPQDSKSKTYSLILTDTVRVGGSEGMVFTKDAPTDLESTSFFFNDEEEEEEKKPKAKKDSRVGAVAQTNIKSTRLRNERSTNVNEEKEAQRKEHQRELHQTMGPKKGQQVPAPQDKQAMIDEAVRLLEDVGRERKDRAAQKHMTALFLDSLRPRKQALELEWAHSGDEPWQGLKVVETALRKGARVEVTFLTPPPPKKAKDGKEAPADPEAVEPAEVKRRLDATIEGLMKLGNEWKPRDARKTAVILYLEGIRTT